MDVDRDETQDEEEDEEEEDDDDEEEDDDEEDGKKRRNSGRQRRTTRTGTPREKGSRKRTEGDEEGGPTPDKRARNDPRRKRGRPPRVDSPLEIRIKNILKALRKLKDEESGRQRIAAFEKLPEKKEFPEYFEEITNPIALDIVRVCILASVGVIIGKLLISCRKMSREEFTRLWINSLGTWS